MCVADDDPAPLPGPELPILPHFLALPHPITPLLALPLCFSEQLLPAPAHVLSHTDVSGMLVPLFLRSCNMLFNTFAAPCANTVVTTLAHEDFRIVLEVPLNSMELSSEHRFCTVRHICEFDFSAFPNPKYAQQI